MRSFCRLKISILFFFILLAPCCRQTEQDPINLDSEIDLNTENTIVTTRQQKITNFYGVVTVNRLRVRALNDIHAKTLRYVDTGQILNVLFKDENRVKINQNEGYWYKIEVEGIKGWVFGYFLQIYSDFEDARYISERLTNPEDEAPVREMPINKNLFFLYKGTVLQLVDYKVGKAVKVSTLDGIYIYKYFFHPRDNKMYYLGKSDKKNNKMRDLYLYSFQENKNVLLQKNVYDCVFNFQDDKVALLGISREKRRDYWGLSIARLKPGSETKSVFKIRKNFDFNRSSQLSKILEKEKGAVSGLSWDTQHNLVYMTLPGEEKTFIISPETNDFITTLSTNEAEYAIDAHRMFMLSNEIQDERKMYIITLYNKATGMQKKIMKSHLVPLHFEVSPDYNYVAITLIDLKNEQEGEGPATSLLVLSLNSYSLIPISIEENSYQPRWDTRRF